MSVRRAVRGIPRCQLLALVQLGDEGARFLRRAESPAAAAVL